MLQIHHPDDPKPFTGALRHLSRAHIDPCCCTLIISRINHWHTNLKAKAVCTGCANVQWHNSWERTNRMLCHFKGEMALIAFRLTRAEPISQFHISNLASDKLRQQYIHKCMAVFLHALGWMVVSVCMFVSARGEGEGAQCRNQLLAQLFMGRWSCIQTLQAKSTSPSPSKPPKWILCVFLVEYIFYLLAVL